MNCIRQLSITAVLPDTVKGGDCYLYSEDRLCM